MGHKQMLRVSKSDGWLPRAHDARPARQDLRSSGGCVIIRSGGCLPGGYPPVPAGAQNPIGRTWFHSSSELRDARLDLSAKEGIVACNSAEMPFRVNTLATVFSIICRSNAKL